MEAPEAEREAAQAQAAKHPPLRKIRAPIKIKSALPPPPPKPKIPPPPKTRNYGHGFSCRTDAFFPGVHKIGAAISGPRIADKHFTDTRIFLIRSRKHAQQTRAPTGQNDTPEVWEPPPSDLLSKRVGKKWAFCNCWLLLWHFVGLFSQRKRDDNKNKFAFFRRRVGRRAERKIVQNAIFHGKHHDNKILKVKMLLSRNFVVMAQAPIFCYLKMIEIGCLWRARRALNSTLQPDKITYMSLRFRN